MNSLRNLNNGILDVMKAMPQKDLTSNNESAFSQTRENYHRTATSKPVPASKKWFGNTSNRDASQIAKNRRLNVVGTGLNIQERPMAFTNNGDANTTNQALNRVRNQGYTVPPKVQNR